MMIVPSWYYVSILGKHEKYDKPGEMTFYMTRILMTGHWQQTNEIVQARGDKQCINKKAVFNL